MFDAEITQEVRYAMLKDIAVVPLRQPDAIDDPPTELVHDGTHECLRKLWLQNGGRVLVTRLAHHSLG